MSPISDLAAYLLRPPVDSTNTLTLPDARKLGYAQYGSLTWRPILYQHGLPGSRIEAAVFDELGEKYAVRIIAIDSLVVVGVHPTQIEHFSIIQKTWNALQSISGWMKDIRRWAIRPCLRNGLTPRKTQVHFNCLQSRAARLTSA
ncbi:hypothetical protein RJZ90_006674 [Blastomyces dermatitidis]